jgi:S-adenosylmethionine:tRNA ribosyltransferase-isomerase
MQLGRSSGAWRHARVAQLTRLLGPGDLLVVNDTRVVPARLFAHKPSGGRVEMLLLAPANPLERLDNGSEVHQVLLRSHRQLPVGQELSLEGAPEQKALILERGPRGRAKVSLSRPALELAEVWGQVPLPPYIKRPQGPEPGDRRRYQTVYASQAGAVAAPTAGLHLSPELLAALARRGVELAKLTLHVGYGTFAEPSPADLAAGRLHAEWVELPESTCQAVARAKAGGGRVVAVGTTSLRALEWRCGPGGVPRAGAGWCDILIAPGHRFQAVDGLITNFHLPRTTLLMLVSALAGRERVLEAYAEAVRQGYRFYSFGDAMMVI